MSRGQVVIVTGSRNWTDDAAILRRLAEYSVGTILLHGDARGADRIADTIGRRRLFQVTRIPYFGDLGLLGGTERNKLLVALGVTYKEHGYDVVVEAFPLPDSRGTWDCVRRAKDAGLRVRDKDEEKA